MTTMYAHLAPTGAITGMFASPNLLPPSDNFVEAPADVSDVTHYVDADGSFARYTDDEMAVRAVWPGPGFQWTPGPWRWVDLRGLDEVRAATWNRIKLARAVAVDGGVTFDGRRYQTDPVSRQAIADAAMLAQADPTHTDTWTTADNQAVDLDAVQLQALQAAVVAHMSAAHAIARELREQINDPAATAEELRAIAWP